MKTICSHKGMYNRISFKNHLFCVKRTKIPFLSNKTILKGSRNIKRNIFHLYATKLTTYIVSLAACILTVAPCKEKRFNYLFIFIDHFLTNSMKHFDDFNDFLFII